DQKMEIANGSILKVKAGQVVEANAVIGTLLDAYAEPIIAEDDGYVHFEDIDDLTVESHVDEQSGVTERIISDLHLDVKQPRIHITDEDGNEFGSYYLPADAILSVEDKQKISAGDVLAKLPKAAQKSNDITGGLPRVSELFEARKSVSPSVLAQITGTVKFKDLKKGKRVIAVEDKYGHVFEHLVPISKRMLVRDGDKVEAGEPLCDGQPSPHDILAIKGENALQNYLMDEIQQVYRAQGVSINDKHIGIIVRQMLRKVEIVAVGDTRFIFGQQVDKYRFREENARVIAEGGQPAIGRPMFQGISKASLSVDSFISAASFQETTRVLTNAAISGSVDALRGVKENVAIGHMIPAGTGIRNYKGVKVYDSGDQDLDIQMNEIIERSRIEKELAEAEAEREKEAATASFDNEDQD
ncbi:MAG: DNA-directed RNA polymerase subunit beta', partial [Treponema sp.]|nr:DNA-directed RNA polymerase subunit beta' [Treponema sp.]